MKSFIRVMGEISFLSKILLIMGFIIFAICELFIIGFSVLVVKVIRRKDTWLYLPALFYKKTWLKYISYIMNRSYKKRYKLLYEKYKLELEERLFQIQLEYLKDSQIMSKIFKILDEFTYYQDPVFGLFDWQGEPAVQYMRMRVRILDHSFDCDDYSRFLVYCIKKLCFYTKAKTVSVVSKKPFMKATHTFVIRDVLGEIMIYAPYQYLTSLYEKEQEDLTREIVKTIQGYYNNEYEYYNFIV